jgi:hypothetical protein
MFGRITPAETVTQARIVLSPDIPILYLGWTRKPD